MKVVCDNCRAVYKIPDEKLVKPVNKATCRNCGHRMLIPRPQPNADPEERTLVTAVPPTPMGAPPRDGFEPNPFDRDSVTQAIEDPHNQENTLPGRPVPGTDTLPALATGTPHTAQGRSDSPFSQAHSLSDDDFLGPEAETKVTQQDAPMPRVDSEETKVTRQPDQLRRYLEGTPEPVPRRTPTPVPSVRRATPATPAPRIQRSATPAPIRQRATPSATPARIPMAPAYDPSSDLNLAILGCLGAIIGSFLLSFHGIYPHPLVMGFGLAVSVGGATTALLVLVTSARGRKPAGFFTSLVAGFVAALFVALAMPAFHVVFNRLAGVPPTQVATAPAGVIDGTPSLASITPPEAKPEPQPEPVEQATETETKAASITPRPAPSPDPRTPAPSPDPRPVSTTAAPSPRPSPRRPAAPAPSPKPAPAPLPTPTITRPAPRPAPAPAPAPEPAMTTVPYEVIDTMLRSNLDVKKCFYQHYQSTGSLPPRVDVQFTLNTTGTATGVSVVQGDFGGTSLEGCLGSAIGSITFPPSGKAQKLTYPFVLQ